MTWSERTKVVLYNPKAVFWTLPLSLLAVGSALDRSRFDVRIVDGRLDPEALLPELEGATVLGISVLTGGPIRDALAVSRAAARRFPELRIVWGGWHPSLFPLETLEESSVDVTVQGQGEITFRELVEAWNEGRDASGVAGLCRRSADGPVRNPPRALQPMDDLPSHDYGLIPVERYFEKKGRRQLDYVSSTGCPFRCAFCADPAVFGRKWVGLAPDRVGRETDELWRRFAFDELAFQDETFFVYRDRAVAIAEEFLARGRGFRWTATLRADQAERLGEEDFALCARSGLRRVLIGVESGTQAMLDRLQKDIRLDQVLEAAEMCARHDVEAIFPFIVGFPGETEEEVRASLALAHRLRSRHAGFDTPVFFFKPYPGSPLSREVENLGHPLPSSVEEWGDFDYIGSVGPWVPEAIERHVERFKFYNRFAGGPESGFRRLLQPLARWRCRRSDYRWPVEKVVVESLFPGPALS